MSDNLFEKLKSYGPPEQVNNTIKHLKEKKSWKEFLEDYNYGLYIKNPYSIQKIVEAYYDTTNLPVIKSLPDTTTTSLHDTTTTSLPSTTTPLESVPDQKAIVGLKPILIDTEDKPTGNFNPMWEKYALETWYTYDIDGNIIKTKKQLHGGKRKSRRNRKIKKSRKKLRKSNRRRR